MRHAGQVRVPIAVQDERRQRRCGRARARGRSGWPAHSPSRRCRSSGSDRPPVASTTRARGDPRVRRRTPRDERVGRHRDGRPRPARPVSMVTPTPARLGQQRIEHGARAVRVGKELAVLFLVQRHAELVEEPRRAVGGKRAQHVRARAAASHPRSRARVTTRFVTLQREPPLTRILAPSRARAVEHTMRSAGRRAGGKDRRRQPGGAGADDRDVGRRRRRHSAARVRGPASAPRGRAGGRRGARRAVRHHVPTTRPRKSRPVPDTRVAWAASGDALDDVDTP